MCKYRMYSLVLRQLSPIQKGVQSAHSIVEYASRFGVSSEYARWSKVDKTLIILDGGTYQEMKDGRELLRNLGVPYEVFHEQDLGNLVTSFSFIVEDKVWDTKTYPSFEETEPVDYDTDSSDAPAWLQEMGGVRNLKLRNFLKSKRLSA